MRVPYYEHMSIHVISEGSKINPHITFNESSGDLEVAGWFFSERPEHFYLKIKETLSEKMLNSRTVLTLHVKLNCFNTASSKCLLILAKDAMGKGFIPRIGKVLWYFNSEDEETKEWGEDIASAAGLDFEYIPSSGL